jgi:hypothetical protein
MLLVEQDLFGGRNVSEGMTEGRQAGTKGGESTGKTKENK